MKTRNPQHEEVYIFQARPHSLNNEISRISHSPVRRINPRLETGGRKFIIPRAPTIETELSAPAGLYFYITNRGFIICIIRASLVAAKNTARGAI